MLSHFHKHKARCATHIRTHHTKYLASIIVVMLAVVASHAVHKARAEEIPAFIRNIIYPLAEGDHYMPSTNSRGVAFDNDGNMYVTDGNLDSVLKFDVNGDYVLSFGGNGTGAGQFNDIGGITYGPDGYLYVADNESENHRVEVFTTEGVHHSQLTLNDPGLQVGSTIDGVIDSLGNLYVVNTFTHEGYKISPAGELVFTFGTDGAGLFTNPRAIDFDSAGDIYVVDGTRVAKYASTTGEYISDFITFPFDTTSHNPRGMAFDASGNLYVVDVGTDPSHAHIKKFDPAGNLLIEFGSFGTGNGEFIDPRGGIAVDSSGNVYVSDADNSRIQKFNSSGIYQSQFGTPGTGDGQLYTPLGIEIDDSGNVYVADANNYRVQKFNSEGVYQSQIGSYGSEDGQFSYTRWINFDSSGNIYIGSDGNIQKFDSAGGFLSKLNARNAGPVLPVDLVFEDSDTLVVSSEYPLGIYKFDLSGNYISRFGEQGSGNGKFGGSLRIAVDADGNIYATDPGNNRVQKFNSSGVYQSQFGTYGTGNGEFDNPGAITLDAEGDIYVTDNSNNRTQKFNASGTFIMQFADNGSGIALDASGNVFLTGGETVKKFDSAGTYLTKWAPSGIIDPDTSADFLEPYRIAVTPSSGVIYMLDDGSDSVIVINREGEYVTRFGHVGEGVLSNPRDIALDSQGNVYVTDCDLGVKKYSSSGVYDASFTPTLTYTCPDVIVIDENDNVYIKQTDENWLVHVEKFNSEWVSQGELTNLDPNGGPEYYIDDMTVDQNGLLYVLGDNSNGDNHVQSFDANGSSTVVLQQNGDALAIDATGNIYVLESDALHKFDSTGMLLYNMESANGVAFDYTQDIAFDSLGYMYIADEDAGKVYLFDNGVIPGDDEEEEEEEEEEPTPEPEDEEEEEDNATTTPSASVTSSGGYFVNDPSYHVSNSGSGSGSEHRDDVKSDDHAKSPISGSSTLATTTKVVVASTTQAPAKAVVVPVKPVVKPVTKPVAGTSGTPGTGAVSAPAKTVPPVVVVPNKAVPAQSSTGVKAFSTSSVPVLVTSPKVSPVINPLPPAPANMPTTEVIVQKIKKFFSSLFGR